MPRETLPDEWLYVAAHAGQDLGVSFRVWLALVREHLGPVKTERALAIWHEAGAAGRKGAA